MYLQPYAIQAGTIARATSSAKLAAQTAERLLAERAYSRGVTAAATATAAADAAAAAADAVLCPSLDETTPPLPSERATPLPLERATVAVRWRSRMASASSVSLRSSKRSSRVAPADGDSDDDDVEGDGDMVSPLGARRNCSRLAATSGSAALAAETAAGVSPAGARRNGGKSPLAKRSAPGSPNSRLHALLLSMRSSSSSGNEGSGGIRIPAGARLTSSSSICHDDGRSPSRLNHGSNNIGDGRNRVGLSDTSSRLSERRSRPSASAHIDQSCNQSSSPNRLSALRFGLELCPNRLELCPNRLSALSRNSAGSHRRRSSTRNSEDGSDGVDPACSFIPLPEGVNLLSELEQRLSATLMPVLRCFVPTMVERKAADGQCDLWVSEHRKLVTIFLKVLHLGPTPCEVAELDTVHRAVSTVQESVIKHGGTVTRLICDDKGVRFLIAFGLPGQSSEDDERRAVLCSLACAATLREIDGCHPAHLAASPPPAASDAVSAIASRPLSRVGWRKIATSTLTPTASYRSGSASSEVSLPEVQKPPVSLPATPLAPRRGTSMFSGQGFKPSARRKQHHGQWLKCSSSTKAILTMGHAPEHAISFKLDCAAGITTGRVFCGEAGYEKRREYTLAGAKVNLAARLMQAAAKADEKGEPCGVLCDAQTVSAVPEGSCQFEELPPIFVKGKAEMVTIFRATSLLNWREIRQINTRYNALVYHSPKQAKARLGKISDRKSASVVYHQHERRGAVVRQTVGRAAELLALRQGLRMLAEGDSPLLVVVGEAGGGKTHLCTELSHMMVEEHRKLPPTRTLPPTDGLTAPASPHTPTLPPAAAAAGPSFLTEDIPVADTEPVAAVRSEDAAVLGAGRSPLGYLLTSCKQTERTTPYHPWRAVFERLFTEDTLRSFVALCDRGSPSPSHPPPQGSPPPPSPLRGSPLRMDGGTSPTGSQGSRGRASFGRASVRRGGSTPTSSPPSRRPQTFVPSVLRGGSSSSFRRRGLQAGGVGTKGVEALSERCSRARVSFDDEGRSPEAAAVKSEGGTSNASFSVGGARPPPQSVLWSVASSSAPSEDGSARLSTPTGADDEASFSSFTKRRTHSSISPTHGTPEGARRASELPPLPHVLSRLASSSPVTPQPPSPPPSPSPVAPRASLPLRAARPSPRASPHLPLSPTLPPPPTSWPPSFSSSLSSWPPTSPPPSHRNTCWT